MIAGEHRLALPAGYQLGQYRLCGVLGSGGFGITYLADDHSLGRRVAIKELLPSGIATRIDGTTVVARTKGDESNLVWARERFVEEGRALAKCDHPNVVHVYEMIEANGTAYMVTKYEEGRSFAEWLTTLGRKPTEAELRSLLDPLLAGLEKVHRAGFLHRDLKPENIYITDDNRPLLLDFGSARQAVTDRTAAMTSIVSTGYAPFEQYYEDGKQGAWSDIYAMAAVLYRAIHGEKPPEATRRLKNDACLKLAKTYGKDYSPRFLNAIDRGLAMEYQDRPQTVLAWRALLGSGTSAVEGGAGQPVVLEPIGWPERLQSVAELALAHPGWTAGLAAGAVLLGGFLIWKIVEPTPDPHPRQAGPEMIAAATTPTPATPAPTPTPVATSTPIPWEPPVATPVVVAPVATPLPKLNPWTNVITPKPAPTPAVDRKIVGAWTTKITNASGSVTLRWEQKDDGHYTLTSGEDVLDSGTVTTEQGQMRRTSADTNQQADVAYEFKGTKLVTTDPNDGNGPMTWTKSAVTSSKEKSSGNSNSSRPKSNSDGPSRSNNNSGGSNWQKYIPRNIPRFPF